MPTKTKKTVKKTEPEMGKCYINAKTAGELDGSGSGMGESFWVEILTKKTAKVCNNCMCGLCIGDVIEFKAYPKDDGVHHPREFVKVIKRVSVGYGLYYTIPGFDLKNRQSGDKLPEDCQKHLNFIRDKGIKFEGMCPGLAAVSRSTEMDEDKFFEILNSGPMKFSTEKSD